MICISDLENFFLSNLGIGVDKTISPREENLIIKIFIFSLLILIPYDNLKSQSNLDSIIYQKKRIQFEIKELDRNFYTESNNNNILVIKDIETGKNLNWEIKIFDRKLDLLQKKIFELDRSYSINKIYSEDKDYKILFKKNYSNEKEYLYIFYDVESNKIKFQEIKLPLSIRINNVLFYNESIVFYGNLKNGKSLIGIYNLITNQLNNIYEYLYYDNDIINIFKEDLKSFYVLISNRGKNGLDLIERKIYDLKGDLIDFIYIYSNNHSIIESKIYSQNNKDIYLSLIGNKNSRESIGIQLNFLENDILKFKKEIYFLEIKSISDFFIENKKDLKRKIKKQDIKKIKLGYELYIDTLFLLNNEIHFSAESIKPNFNNDGFSNYSYMPFYNTYSGTYDNKINPKFGGYTHDLNFYIKTDNEGNLISSLISPIKNLNTFYNTPYKNYISKERNLIEFYVNKGIINIADKEFESNFMLESSINLKSINDDVIVKTETNPEGTNHWYDDNYYSYGVQRLKKNKRVFFISNFEINR